MGKHRRSQFFGLIALTLVGSLAEVASLGAVVPFIGVLLEPDKVFNFAFVREFSSYLEIQSGSELIFPLTAAFILASFFSGAVRLLLLWANTKFAFGSGAEISIDVFRRTLYQPYPVHLSRNSSEVVSGIIAKVDNVVFWTMLPVLTLISSTAIVVSILVTLFLINPLIASIAFSTFGGSYCVLTYMSKRKLRANAKRISEEQTKVVKALQEGLGGIRDVLLNGTQESYCDLYRKADLPLRQAYGSNIFIAGSPRFIMEALGVAFIALLAFLLQRYTENFTELLPVLGALALGAQRLLPALQQSYSSLASIRGSQNSLSDILDLLEQSRYEMSAGDKMAPLKFRQGIRFENVSFSYPNSNAAVFNDFNLEINKGQRVGIVGPSGSGKSTFQDLLMGLLQPSSGGIFVDGVPLETSLIRSWQKNIANVPQRIYLADVSILQNIAFGYDLEDIDLSRVKKAAEQAQISELINKLPDGYNTFVGERGVRLSGGQCQRIAIARALYKDASVIVLDEATSALDSKTEASVMDVINDLNSEMTVIIVAHRESTLQNCDKIIRIDSQNRSLLVADSVDG